jgi:UDP-N-acetylglucosamine diphosphorylase/glucosamine-1-phosphate N-acetyltransferase
MTVCLFEHTSDTFLPLTHIRPVYDLRCGMFTALERARALFPGDALALLCRPALRDAVAERTGLSVNAVPAGETLFLNGGALLTASLAVALRELSARDCVVMSGPVLLAIKALTPAFRDQVAARLPDGDAPSGVDTVELHAPILTRPWELIAHTEAMLRLDAMLHPLGHLAADAVIAASAELIAPGQIVVGTGARIGAGVVIDASDGPVVIGPRATVMHQAVILGPAFIGADATVKIGAKIYHATSVGPVCKVGGEVEGSIFHSYANKQHDGFVGHSYFAPWTNLGADTNTSDLKNNYSGIRMTLEGVEHRTGTMFLGTVMADHAKTGINTMLNTGTTAGVACNIYGGGFPPKYLPSFTWGGADGLVEYDFERCAAVADAVMRRRGLSLTDAERTLLRHVFDSTQTQR